MQKKYDLAVIGGGPAGMIAAGRAAELGAKVILIEKNPKLGKKLLITGGGRCNITNAEFDVKKLVAKYGPKGKALFGSFSRFGVEDAMAFFTEKNLPLKVEAEKRAFPVSNKAEDVWKVLVEYLKKNKVEILYNSPVSKVNFAGNKITSVQTKTGLISADNFVITTGGKSRPETGSTGEGLEWLKEMGHSIEEAGSALVPVKIKEDWVKNLSGLSFMNAKLSVFQDGKKQESRSGKLLLTHFGLSGPLVLNMSQNIAELFKYGPVQLELDICPEMDLSELDKKTLDSLSRLLNKKIKNSLGEVVPIKMIATVLEMTGIDGEKEVNVLSREERLKILKLIKALPMTVSGFLGVEKAIITSGGVSLKEVDFKTMQSKLYENLYLAGDILNFDRPSGGYNLQICWTTGYIAGQNAGVHKNLG
ncbi:MAG: NAD(FAD)-utilizing dehydrogenase [Candidatus Doudnabacteria bacterium]|nr:NAD(FAD)-utilizing dehydrogenase [Candidatus Doudnabacteria bacterium]